LDFASQNYDNIYFKIAYKNQSGKKLTENNSQAFNNFQEGDVGRTIEGFRDVNSKILDVDAIIKKYGNVETKFKTGKFSEIEFYRVKDNISNTINSLSKRDFLDPKFNNILKGQKKRRYSLDNIQTFRVSELEKYSIEADSRVLKNLASEETGATKFERYTEPGGTDYTELVFKIKKGGMDIGIPTETTSSLPGGKTFRTRDYVPFKSPAHMDVKSEIAHVRFKTRNLNDMKVLTVEEMQSDFAIAAKRGTETGKKVTDFPFKNTWYELTVKRLIRYAADNGFDAVAIPKGSVAASRYGQKGGVATKVQIRDFDNHIQVFYKDKKGELIADPIAYKFSGFEKTEAIQRFKKAVGDDIANSYLAKRDKRRALSTDKRMMSLTLPMQTFDFKKPIFAGEGKGKHELYDQAIPSFMKKYGKKWNAKVYDEELSMDMDDLRMLPVTIIKLTPEMKKAVQQEGQALFEILGSLGASGIAAKAVSDSKGNNTISN